MKLTLLLFLFFTSIQFSFAIELASIKPELGIGHSDNVYQDDLNKKSDFFTWLQLRTRYNLVDSSLTAKANMTFYSNEKSNNSISYSLYNKSDLNYNRIGLNFGFGGLNYFQSESGSTDESFNNFYGIAYLNKTILSKINLNVIAESGLKISAYPKLENRRDLTLFAKLDNNWNFKHHTELNPYLEIGFVFSNQNYYSKNYFDIGISWFQTVDELYKFNIDLFIRNSTYPNRKIADILVLPRRKGRITSANMETNENISLSQLTGTLMRTDENRELSLGFNVSSENSLSHLEYYNEIQLFVSATWNY